MIEPIVILAAQKIFSVKFMVSDFNFTAASLCSLLRYLFSPYVKIFYKMVMHEKRRNNADHGQVILEPEDRIVSALLNQQRNGLCVKVSACLQILLREKLIYISERFTVEETFRIGRHVWLFCPCNDGGRQNVLHALFQDIFFREGTHSDGGRQFAAEFY